VFVGRSITENRRIRHAEALTSTNGKVGSRILLEIFLDFCFTQGHPLHSSIVPLVLLYQTTAVGYRSIMTTQVSKKRKV
jgi:hypothetical protein